MKSEVFRVSKVSDKKKIGQTIMVIPQTFGVKTVISLENNIPILRQLDVHNKVFSQGIFQDRKNIKINKNGKNRQFNFFSLNKKYSGNSLSTKVLAQKQSNELLIENFLQIPKKKKREKYKSNNIYHLLSEIGKLDITIGSAPDYLSKENEIILKHGERTASLYRLYYASMGKYRVYNALTYINEQVNLRMGQVLNLLDIPAIILHSGDGKEIFIYLGMHICPQDSKVYYGFLLLSFDLLSICRDLLYYLEKCPLCHSNIKGNMNGEKVLFKIQKMSSKI